MTDRARNLIESIESLDAKATPGRWTSLGSTIETDDYTCDDVVSSEVDCGDYCLGGTGLGIQNSADGRLIAMSRTVLPKLAAALKAVLDVTDDLDKLADRNDQSDYVCDQDKARVYELTANDLRKAITKAIGSDM